MPPSLRMVEHHLRGLLRLWALLFTGMAILLAFLPGHIIAVLNHVGVEWIHWSGPPMVAPPDRFFSALACSLLVLLALLAYSAQSDPRRRLAAIRAILVSKIISSGIYAVSYLADAHYFAYVVGAIIDGTIFAVTYYYYRRARHLI